MAIPNGYNPTIPKIQIPGQASFGLPTVFTDEDTTPIQVAGNINNFQQIYHQNKSNGDSAFTDFIAAADNDSLGIAGRFADMGITSSGFVGTDAATGIIKTVSITAGGTGYTVGNELTILTGDANARVRVLTVSGGAVTSVQIIDNGTNYTTGTKATSGGTGTGCTINVLTFYVYTAFGANDGYFYTSGGNTVIATDDTVAGKIIKFFTGGLATANERARLDDTGMVVMPVSAPTAGGTTGRGLRLGSTANFGIFFGSGAPTLSAAQGSLYMRTDGSSTTTRMYVNTNGTTGWTHVVTGA